MLKLIFLWLLTLESDSWQLQHKVKQQILLILIYTMISGNSSPKWGSVNTDHSLFVDLRYVYFSKFSKMKWGNLLRIPWDNLWFSYTVMICTVLALRWMCPSLMPVEGEWIQTNACHYLSVHVYVKNPAENQIKFLLPNLICCCWIYHCL